jgi:O-antigen/teichoic acid export membrane protein
VEQAASAAETGTSLREVALRGSAMELAGYAAGQALRLAGNLVLSRLLFPEAFGLSALVSVFLVGLQLLSDVGLEPCVVQSERGDERRFLDTIWTLQVARGALLALMALLLAWPAAALYGEPQLLALMAVSGLTALIGGFESTSLLSLRRHVRLGPLMALEVAARVVGLAVMVAWAWWSPSVWALVAGGVVDALARLAGSHVLNTGPRNRLDWDPTAARSVLQFGKWIFASSAVFFFGRQGDRLLLGHYLGMRVLGVYSIALFLSEAVGTLVSRITHGVFFPIFSRVARESATRLGTVYYATRLRTDLLALPAVGALAVLGDDLVDLLYDDRYTEAGWILQALCVRVAMSCVTGPCETCLFALGQTRYAFYSNLAMTLWVWIGIPVGWWLAGLEGLVWATALSGLPVLVTVWAPFRRTGMLRPGREALALLAFGAGMALGALAEGGLQALRG